jgi:peptidoglycan/LPS O-acetylase OafA/YrhL
MDAPMWGCIFALYNDKIKDYLSFLIRYSKLFFYLPFVLILFSISFGVINNTYHLHLDALNAGFFQAIGIIPNLAIGCIILISLIKTDTIWFKILNTKIFDYTGKISYSLYLWQQMFTLDARFFSLLSPLYIFLAANISYHLVERPFLRLKKYFSDGKEYKKISFSKSFENNE